MVPLTNTTLVLAIFTVVYNKIPSHLQPTGTGTLPVTSVPIPVKINRYRSKLNDTAVPTGTVPSVQFPLVHVYTHTPASLVQGGTVGLHVCSNRSYTGCIQRFTRTILYTYVPCTHVCAHTPVHLHTHDG